VQWGGVASNEMIHLRQGVEIGRPSDLFLCATLNSIPENSNPVPGTSRITNVRVGGSTILVAKGRLFLP
jgi:trans-2,3-dihydro-3-hydroxyanthranilate isomerase